MGEIVIVDEVHSAGELVRFFRKNGLTACVGTSSEVCYRTLDRRRIGVLIIADRLRGFDGFDLCRQVRARANIPIIMLVPADDVTGKVLALEVGADDCLTRPISRNELLARIRAVRRRYRRAVSLGHEPIEIGGLRVEPSTGRVTDDGIERRLTRDQFVLLLALIRNAGSVIGRDELRDALRAIGAPASERSIDVHICRLRSRVERDPRNPVKILTARGTGYIFSKGGEDSFLHAG